MSTIKKRTWVTSKGEQKSAWQLNYVDQLGKRSRKQFSTKREAEAYETDVRHQIKQGTHVSANRDITLTEAAEEWIRAVRNGRGNLDPAEPSTVRQYRYHRDQYILPRLDPRGTVKLSQIDKTRLMSFRDGLLEDLSRPLARKVLTSLKGILSEAQDRGHLSINHAAKIRIGLGDRHDEGIAVPSVVDIQALLLKLDELATSNGSPISEITAKAWRRRRVLIAVAIHTGLRASELRGLPWDAVDLKKGQIEVKQRADEQGRIGSPKSRSSRRKVPIPKHITAMLREWKLECPADCALVFPSEQKRPQSLANIYNRVWKPLQLAAGICDPVADETGNVIRDAKGNPRMKPRYRFHDLRHFHASMLIRHGANPKEVQVEMGHASIQITYDLYGHLFEDDEAEQRSARRAEKLAASLQ